MDPKEKNDSKIISWCENEKGVDFYLKDDGEETSDDEFYEPVHIRRIKIEKEDLDLKESEFSLKVSFNIMCKNVPAEPNDSRFDNDVMGTDAIKKETIEVNATAAKELNYCQEDSFKLETIEQEEVHIKDDEANENSLNEKKNDEENNSNDTFQESAPVKGIKKKLNKGIPKSGKQLLLHKCPQCSYKTAFKHVLKSHSLRHKKPDEIDWYRCQECPFKTCRKGNLKLHTEIHKSKEERLQKKMHQCTKCPYKTSRKSTLMRHGEIHKSKEERLQKKIHQCPECPYNASLKNSLKRHRKIHMTEEEIFQKRIHQWLHCPECFFKTIRPSRLRSHVLAHKNNAFKCALCSFKSLYKSNFVAHLIRHKSADEIQWFECLQCSYKTARKRLLKQHQLKHKEAHEIAWFCCYECSFKTKYKSVLVRHISTHKKQFDKGDLQIVMKS